MNSKKTLAILIVASMLCSTSVSAQPFDNSELEYETVQTEKVNASSGTCGENVTWTLDDAGTLTITGTGDMTNYTSPLDVPWYSNRSSVKSVIIGDGVTSIGNYAFYYCSSLTSITIPDSVTSIGDDAFNQCCGLTSITIPDGVTSIGDSAFKYCSSLTSVVIPDSVTSIGGYAFRDCSSLASVTIPDSVTSIGNYAFSGCSNLASVTIPDSVTSIGERAFENCSSLTSVVIPDSVTSIGDDTFSGCSSLASVTIPDSVTSIGVHAFKSCTSLTSVTIGDGVTSIGGYAFVSCSNLTSVTIPDSVTSIGDHAFKRCTSLTSVTIGDGVTSIGNYTFAWCSSLASITVDANNEYYSSDEYGVLFNKDKTEIVQYPIGNKSSSYTIPDSVTSIGEGVFSDCSSLTSITIPDSVTSIDSYAFSECSSLTSITIPDSVTNIGEFAFFRCLGLASLTIGDGVTNIGDSAFEYCSSLMSVTIGDGVTNIGDDAFYNCSSLTSITIPDSVTSIGDYAFCKCSSLIEITIPEHLLANINDTVFEGCNLEKITVRSSTIDGVYDISIDIINTAKLPNSVKFEEAGYSSNVLIIQNDDGVSIGSTDLSKISNIIVSYGSGPDAPIDSHKIYICTSDGTVLGSAQLSQKGDFWAEGQRAVIIPVSTDYSGEIVIKKDEPGHMIAIDIIILTYGFGEGTIVEGGTCGENLTWTLDDSGTLTISGTGYMTNYYSWSSDAPWYNNRSSVKSVVISDGVTSIGERAFADCSSLTSITIPVSVTSIYNYAFSGCNSLTDVYYNGSKKKWNNIPLGRDNECLLNATLHLTNIPAEILYGDANGDGAVNGKDVLTLRKYMVNYDYDTGTSSVEVSSGADANGDGIINGKDVLLMRKYMVNYDYETGTSSVKLGPSLPELPDGFTLIDISELEKTFLTDHPDLIPGQKDRHFGVINKNGDIVVPFEYDSIVAPTSDGYTLVGKQSTEIIDGEEVIAYDDYLFDKDGNVVYSTHSYGWPYATENERLGFYQNGLIITYKQSEGVIDASNDTDTWYLRRLDGTLIRTIEYVDCYLESSYTECIVLSTNTPEGEYKTFIIDFNGETIDENSGSFYYLDSNGAGGTGVFGGYYIAYKHPPIQYEAFLENIDGSERYDLKNGSSFSVTGHYGKTVIAYLYESGKYVLLDAAILDSLEGAYSDPTWHSEAIISEYEYDYIACRIFRDRDEKYFCVSRDGKVGYLSYDLKTEVLYDEASEFINGKAIIREGDKFYIINDSFEKISDEITGYSDFRLSVMGENMYTLTKGDTVYLLIHDCE